MTRAALAAIVPCSHFPGDARVVITGARCSSCEEARGALSDAAVRMLMFGVTP